MANLKAIREKIKNITDYSPELQQFNDQLDELINDAYYSIWTMKRWNFATKLSTLHFHIDMTTTVDDDSGVGGVNANVTNGVRQVTFSHNMDRLGLIDVWEGQPIAIQGQEYTISKITGGNSLLLTSPFLGTTSTDDTSWIIKKRWYDLPEDCLELLYIGHRDYPYNATAGTQNPYGKSSALLPRREEDINLRADYASDYAEAYIPSPTLYIEPAETLELTVGDGGSVQNNSYYEICWAFVKDGKVGALSEPKIVYLGEGDSKIFVSFMSWDGNSIEADTYNSADTEPSNWESYRKIIYWNKNLNRSTGERQGLPCWLELINGGGTRNTPSYLAPVIVEDTLNMYTITNINQFDNGAKRYIERDGQWQQIRPYPRVNGFDFEIPHTQTQKHNYVREGVIRYLKKPQDMLLATDSPEMPYEFHQLIVYKALEDIYLKLGQQTLASTYEKKYSNEIKNLEKRYVDKIDFQVVRGQFSLNGQFYSGYNGATLRRLN
jgi:hypothetical protein